MSFSSSSKRVTLQEQVTIHPSSVSEVYQVRNLDNLNQLSWIEKIRFAGIDAFPLFIGIYFSYNSQSIQNGIYWTLQYIYSPSDARVIGGLWLVFFLFLVGVIALNVVILRLRHTHELKIQEKRQARLRKKQVKETSLTSPTEGSGMSSTTLEVNTQSVLFDEDDDLPSSEEEEGEEEGEDEAEGEEEERVILEEKVKKEDAQLPPLSTYESAVEYVEQQALPPTEYLFRQLEREDARRASRMGCGSLTRIALEFHEMIIFSSWVLMFSLFNFFSEITIPFYFEEGSGGRALWGNVTAFVFLLILAVAFIIHFGAHKKKQSDVKIIYKLMKQMKKTQEQKKQQ